MDVLVNITNPTNYSATVPYIDINILNNGTLLGHATAQNVSVIPGRNENIAVKALWDPVTPSGKHGLDVGRELLSQYISGEAFTFLHQYNKADFQRLQYHPDPQNPQWHHSNTAEAGNGTFIVTR